MGAAAGGQLASGAMGAAAGGPSAASSSGEQGVSTGSKDFNFGNPNKGLYANSSGAGALGSPVVLAALALLSLLSFYYLYKKK